MRFNWLRVGTTGGLLGIWQLTFGCENLAKDYLDLLSACQEGLCSVKFKQVFSLWMYANVAVVSSKLINRCYYCVVEVFWWTIYPPTRYFDVLKLLERERMPSYISQNKVVCMGFVYTCDIMPSTIWCMHFWLEWSGLIGSLAGLLCCAFNPLDTRTHSFQYGQTVPAVLVFRGDQILNNTATYIVRVVIWIQ